MSKSERKKLTELWQRRRLDAIEFAYRFGMELREVAKRLLELSQQHETPADSKNRHTRG